MRECFCLFLFMLHLTKGCVVSDHGQIKYVTAYTGGSVLLPCSCVHSQSTAQTFTWHYTNGWSDVLNQKKNKSRLKLFSQTSPANLSLIISDLRKQDEGEYRCTSSQSHTDIRVEIKGCDLDQSKQTVEVTGHSGESVLLPCSCTELQAKPHQLKWTFTPLKHKANPEEIYPNERHSGRVKHLKETSPGNLSLHILNLNKEDEGEYRCSVSDQEHLIRLNVQVDTVHTTNKPVKQTEEPTTEQSGNYLEKLSLILLSVFPVLLLLAVLALIYWKWRGRRNVQKMTNDGLVLVHSESEKRGDINPSGLTQGENVKQDENEDEVTYSSVVHVKTDAKPAHKQTVVTEHSEYASIKSSI